MIKKIAIFILSASLCLAAFSACGETKPASSAAEGESTPSENATSESTSDESTPDESTPDENATSLADIKAKGKLIIGLDDSFAPMGFRDIDNNLIGFDIDLATKVCEDLGVEAEFQPIDWAAKEMELSTGRIDCIWNGMSMTPERQEAMSLSKAYLQNKIVVMSKDGIDLSEKAGLKDVRIGIQAGSAALEAVTTSDIYNDIKDNITEYPTYDEAILDMAAGRIDSLVIDEVFGNYKNMQMESKMVTAPFDFGEDLYGIGFRKSDVELTEAVNNALDKINASSVGAEISEQWFGKDIMIKK